mmetsp:Transcript_9742/g.15433  ORF Transcript_9742/g.15433 Transcript_9742/m.15433 type:complete len:216 (-) Transcript_9742:887-1534(-)|eukprot:CAMPEP_0179435292 /NCGR_PEP_ID=MMETSP0799-20121207/19437_1 /TAXON_ID=46947 /ORGANISM="Geminigera cryophila, Strain CCMP2564" /LENGTH=215 /DNA_ID=CAMNT_0021214587 /DNA_START=346 /DNA_END=993 /DNA_ORIENTATION=-
MVGHKATVKLPNPLLLPIEVGKPKPTAMELPPPDHVYGMKSDLDCEGAGAVMGGWMEHAPNAASVPGRDFKRLNRMAINAGQGLTANQISHFRKKHDARLKGGHPGKADGGTISLPSSQDPSFAYGVKSGGRIPMEALMQNEYQNQWVAQQGRKDDQYLNAKQKIPVMHTRASLGHRYVEPVVDVHKPFKLKKFANIPGKLHVPGVISPGRVTGR